MEKFKSILVMIVTIVLMKLLVFIGVFSTNDTAIPISLKIDLNSKNIEFEIDKSGYIKYDCKIIEGKALINNKLVNDLSIVNINGNDYIIDIKANYVELQEYKLIQKIFNNFRILNKKPVYKWTFYIRSIIYILAFFAIFGDFKEVLFWSLIVIPVFAFLTLFIANYLNLGIWGYIIYFIIIIIDVILGAMASGD